MTITVTLPRLHDAQWDIVSSPARFKVMACGRRFGKTLLGSGECVRRAVGGDLIWWIAPTYRTAEFGWHGIRRMSLQLPGVTIRESDRTAHFPGGGYIQARSGDDPNALRGAGLDLAVLDEAAFMSPDVWNEAIRPALSDKQGEAWFVSTPNGRNWFWSLYMMGLDPARTEWASWRFPTSANPYIKAEEIEAARELLPKRIFSQEYLAEFTEDDGAVFRGVSECATATPQDGPQDGHRYCFGVDWARESDFTVIAVFDITTRELVALDRFNEISWSLQRGRLAALYNRWQPDVIWAEANSIGGPNIEALQAEGLPVTPFTTTAQSKGPLIESLALAFEQSEICIVNDAVLVGELQAYTLKRLPSGRYQYSAPAGMHDDTVIAAALAWHGSTHSGIGISFA